MNWRVRARGVQVGLLAGAAMTVAGCGLFGGDAASFSANYLFFTLGRAVPGGPPMAPFQMRFLPDTFIFDLSGGMPRFICEHDNPGTILKSQEQDIPYISTCEPEPELPPTIEMPFTGRDGANPTPPGYRDWIGGDTGGCGTWSVAMCDRVLHRTDPSLGVSMDEWTRISTAIHGDDGSSLATDRAQYFSDAGYCSVRQKFAGTAASYDEARMRFGMNCDLKVEYFKRDAEGHYSNGHVETVTDVGAMSLTMNSWGHDATVTGGSDGGFRHDRPFQQMVGPDGTTYWPAESTDVWISYVCPCGGFEALGQILLDSAGP